MRSARRADPGGKLSVDGNFDYKGSKSCPVEHAGSCNADMLQLKLYQICLIYGLLLQLDDSS
jgi:hypothetical protein